MPPSKGRGVNTWYQEDGIDSGHSRKFRRGGKPERKQVTGGMPWPYPAPVLASLSVPCPERWRLFHYTLPLPWGTEAQNQEIWSKPSQTGFEGGSNPPSSCFCGSQWDKVTNTEAVPKLKFCQKHHTTDTLRSHRGLLNAALLSYGGTSNIWEVSPKGPCPDSSRSGVQNAHFDKVMSFPPEDMKSWQKISPKPSEQAFVERWRFQRSLKGTHYPPKCLCDLPAVAWNSFSRRFLQHNPELYTELKRHHPDWAPTACQVLMCLPCSSPSLTPRLYTKGAGGFPSKAKIPP